MFFKYSEKLNKIITAILIWVVLFSYIPVDTNVALASSDTQNQCVQNVVNIVSDSTTLVDGVSSVPTYKDHPDWTASIPGATWIWSTYLVEDPLSVVTKNFVRNFDLTQGDILSASITIAADNTYSFSVNDTNVATDTTNSAYFESNKTTYDIKDHLKSGSNKLSISVTNLTHPQALTPETNPAGLIYILNIVQDCVNPTNTPPRISLIGANPMDITVGTVFVDPGATATDTEDGVITDKIVRTGTVNASSTGTYTLIYSVTDSGGLSASTTRTVNVKNAGCTENCGGGGGNPTPSVTLTANPTTINLGATSTLSWNSQNVTSCSANWMDATSTTGNKVVSPATTTQYSISCTGQYGSASATTTVIVNPAPQNQCILEFVSDDKTLLDTGAFATNTYSNNPRWTAVIPGATWIWKTFFVEQPTKDEYAIFVKNFNINDVSLVDSASILVAADNSYAFDVNNLEVARENSGTNYTEDTKDVYNIKSKLKNGQNTLIFTVKNWATEHSSSDTNPAGLLYKLSINTKGVNCNPAPNPTNTPPRISLIGANPMDITVGTVFVDPGATATDTEDGVITDKIVRTGTVNASSTGTYTLIYSVTDSGGLSASTTRTVNVKNAGCTENCGGGGGNPTPSVTLTANPTTINLGATSTLSWNSQNVTSCSANWMDATSTTGNKVVSPATTTQYSISCTGQYGSASATTTVAVFPVSTPIPTVNLSANPTSIKSGGSSTLSWDAQNVTSCSAPWTTSTSTSGTQIVSPNITTNYSIVCTGNHGTVSATTTVNFTTDNGGGGGGGGGGGSNIGGRRRDISNLLAPQGEVLGVSSCSYLRDYLRRDWNNDRVEVLKLQSFLNVFEGEKLSLTAVFDEPTYQAVSRFQNKYFNDILEPWGHEAPTGFVYILTKKKVNEIYCNTVLYLNDAQKQEIASFKALLDSYKVLSDKSSSVSSYDIKDNSVQNVIQGTLSEFSVDEIVELKDIEKDKNASTTLIVDKSFLSNLAVSLFALPETISANYKNIIIFLFALVIIFFFIRRFLSEYELPQIHLNKENEIEGNIHQTKDVDSPIIILPGSKRQDK